MSSVIKDIKPSVIKDIKPLLESGILISLGCGYFKIKGSDARYDSLFRRWEITNSPEDYVTVPTIVFSFEEVLEQMAPEIQTQLLFHLDLFG